MNVKITEYGITDDKGCVKYKISGLSLNQLKILDNELEEETELNKNGKYLILTMYYKKEFYPFASEESKIKLDDFIAREEIEMEIFISSFLEDFN
ncbi:hypothetical protein LJB96_02225 [Methanobrevibacter sp. OttesenSCG-928-K11]|nr:hypothetical protein [Methanobrevibacter sp. OttesenSCG-928-K11]MDL2270583.1 hypothetical protein [Methanobrevibacter sp. OttesenSCG-928-I08]